MRDFQVLTIWKFVIHLERESRPLSHSLINNACIKFEIGKFGMFESPRIVLLACHGRFAEKNSSLRHANYQFHSESR
jgi:hypothetical protein